MSEIRLVTVYSGFVPGVSSGEDRDLAPVIAVRRSTESCDTWQAVYENIALKTKRKVFVVNVTIPENGESGDIGDKDYHNNSLNHFMEERNISTAVLIGHNLAAYIVLPLAFQKPEKVEKLIVTDIQPRDTCQVLSKLMYEFVSLMKISLSAIPAGADEDTAKKAIRDYIFSKMPELKEFLSGLFEEDMPLICKNGVYGWDENIEKIQEKFEVPAEVTFPVFEGQILFLNGAESDIKVNNFENKAITLNFFPNARLYDIESTTHTMPKEDVAHQKHQELLREVAKFLNE